MTPCRRCTLAELRLFCSLTITGSICLMDEKTSIMTQSMLSLCLSVCLPVAVSIYLRLDQIADTVTRFHLRCMVILKPGTHWQQGWIQHGRLRWKSTVSLWSRTHWWQSRPYWQQSPPRWRQCRTQQAVEFKLLPICRQNRQQSRAYWRQSTLLPICLYWA